MKLSIKNIGKIESADIVLDGITVICGENNTGKSTVGKVLFSYFNSMCDFESKIREQKIDEIRRCILKYCKITTSFPYLVDVKEDFEPILSLDANNISIKDIDLFVRNYPEVRDKKSLSQDIYSILIMSNEDLLSEYIFRYFMEIFNGQVRNENAGSRQKSIVKTIFKNGTNAIKYLFS